MSCGERVKPDLAEGKNLILTPATALGYLIASELTSDLTWEREFS